jgi:hypothetical protein
MKQLGMEIHNSSIKKSHQNLRKVSLSASKSVRFHYFSFLKKWKFIIKKFLLENVRTLIEKDDERREVFAI